MMVDLTWVRWTAVGLLLASGCSDDGVGVTPGGSTTGHSGASTSNGTPLTSDGSSGSPEGSGEGTSADSTSGPQGSGSSDGDATGTTVGDSTGEATDTTAGATTGSSGSDSGTDTGGSSSSDGGESTAGLGDTPVGQDCMADNDCMSGVCWDFADYDPFCGGAICSVGCKDNQDCVDAFGAVGAPAANNVTCGMDNRCVALESGLGAFFCAGG